MQGCHGFLAHTRSEKDPKGAFVMDDDKMTDEALSTLKLLRTSAPSAEAKKLALNAAMMAFDAAQPKAAQPKRTWINRWMLGAGLGVPLTTAVAALVLLTVAKQLTATYKHLTGVPLLLVF